LSYLNTDGTRNIEFSGFERLYGGSAADRFTALASGASLGIFGGGGLDTLIGPSTGGLWEISGADAGSLGSAVPFSQIENLTGLEGVDRFLMRQTGSISGRIDAGSGANILDYSPSTLGIQVDLSNEVGIATRIGSVLDRFSILVGSTVADTLRSSNTRGLLVLGLAGNDVIYGSPQRDVLVGGLGSDQLYGGNGEDILIGGRTTFDTNLSAMLGVLDEWSRTSTASTQTDRYNNLSNITPAANRLNGNFYLRGMEFTTARTLNDDNAVDKLFGQGDLDWYIGGTASTANDFAAGNTDYSTDQRRSTAFRNL